MIISQPSDQETHLGSSVLFTVENIGDGAVQWEFNGSPIAGANGKTLELSEVSLENVGFYLTKITSEDFSEYSDDAELRVNHFPAGELPRLVKDLDDRLASLTPLREGVVFKEKLYYLRDNLSDFPQLWVTDGTKSNDRKYFEIASDAAGFFIRDGWHWGHNEDAMYFEAPHTDLRWLWKTDGESSPIPLVQIDSGGSGTTAFTSAGFYFGKDDQLWLTNGTPEGTRMISEIGPTSSGDREIIAVGAKVYYHTRDQGSTGMAVSDGSNLGTFILKDPGGSSLSNPGDMMVQNERLYFLSTNRFFFGPALALMKLSN